MRDSVPFSTTDYPQPVTTCVRAFLGGSWSMNRSGTQQGGAGTNLYCFAADQASQ